MLVSMHMTAGAADLSDWAVNEYIESNSTGLLSYRIASSDLRSNITREEFCELAINLYEKLTNEDLRVPGSSPFTDCDNVAVSQAYYNGIVKGVTEDVFEPHRPVTRQEMAQMLVNTLNAGEVSVALNTGDGLEYIKDFSDAHNVSPWAQSAVATMVSHSLLSGNEGNEIMPLANTTREQAITCVNRCYKTFSEINQDRYMLPIINSPASGAVDGDVIVAWSTVEGADGYYILVKNSKGELVYNAEVNGDTTSHVIDKSSVSRGSYSVIVGAIMGSGDVVFSVPLDFATGAAQGVSASPASENSDKKPIINYEHEVLTDSAKAILAEAEKYIGVNYVYGGTTPSGFDCSGFVKYVFGNCGISLNRVSRDQYAKDGYSVAKAELEPGDLVFFGTGGTVSHVGIYAGGGQMIHSPSTGKTVCYTSINSDYYLSHYIGAKRVLK